MSEQYGGPWIMVTFFSNMMFWIVWFPVYHVGFSSIFLRKFSLIFLLLVTAISIGMKKYGIWFSVDNRTDELLRRISYGHDNFPEIFRCVDIWKLCRYQVLFSKQLFGWQNNFFVTHVGPSIPKQKYWIISHCPISPNLHV